MATVTIDTVSYFAYASLAVADAYLGADASAANWRAAVDDDKGRALVTATRILDRQYWLGEKADEDQPNAWPRSGITGVDDDETPQEIIDGCCMLASAIIDGFNQATNTAAGGGTKRLKADTVEIEYFRANDEAIIPLPLPVWQLISPYLGGAAASISSSESTGTDGCWPFSQGWGFTQGF